MNTNNYPIRLRDAQRRVGSLFEKHGYQLVRPPILMQADYLLDFYGEDLRARAFLLEDSGLEEQCLRPDFTLPLCQMVVDAEPKEYRFYYCGTIFRRQEPGSSRPVEQIQLGIEHLGLSAEREKDDATIWRHICDALAELDISDLDLRMGDLRFAFDMIDNEPMPEGWRAHLLRHFCRPAHFLDLLERYSLAAKQRQNHLSPMAENKAPHIGLRSREEIEWRLQQKKIEAQHAPLPKRFVDNMRALLGISGNYREVLPQLRSLRDNGAVIEDALAGLETRIEALDRAGFDVQHLPFSAGFGREITYYDGFVFEIHSRRTGSLIAGGGRYDNLPASLGADKIERAVGGVIRLDTALTGVGLT